MHNLIVGIGSNVGNRVEFINTANTYIINEIGNIKMSSSLYETKAWGNTQQSNFINCVVVVETSLLPLEIIEKLLIIEKNMGRIRSQKWSERIIDLDILFYNDVQINTPGLIIPHPHIQERNFVLDPINEIWPEFIHPKYLKTINRIKNESIDTSWIIKI